MCGGAGREIKVGKYDNPCCKCMESLSSVGKTFARFFSFAEMFFGKRPRFSLYCYTRGCVLN